MKPSEIASAGTFPSGTKVEPNWIDSPSLSLGGGIGIDFTKIDGGGALYGIQIGDFYIANTEITRGQWKAVMLKNDGDVTKEEDWLIKDGVSQWNAALSTGESTDMTMPMNKISWYDAILFCNRLSDIHNRKLYYKFEHDEGNCTTPGHSSITWSSDNYWDLLKFYTPTLEDSSTKAEWMCIKVTEDTEENKEGFRIPHAIYWEYAARGGKDGKYTKYSGTTGTDDAALNAVAWWGSTDGNSGGKVHPVALKGGDNPVRDMTGNVWEWCWDVYKDNRRLYIGGPYDGGRDYQPISNREVYKGPNGSVGKWTAEECANGTANETNGYAGATGDRSKGMGIRIVVPVLPR